MSKTQPDNSHGGDKMFYGSNYHFHKLTVINTYEGVQVGDLKMEAPKWEICVLTPQLIPSSLKSCLTTCSRLIRCSSRRSERVHISLKDSLSSITKLHQVCRRRVGIVGSAQSNQSIN